MTTYEAIAQTSPSGERDYLTLQDIANACHVSYKTVRQYADKDCVKEFMGGYEHPSSKGLRWPPESEPKWRMLFDTAEKGLIQPGTVAAWLQNVTLSPSIAQPLTLGKVETSEALALLPQLGNEAVAIGNEAIVLLRQLVHAQMPPEDCLLDAQGAAHILCCHPSNVRKYVRPVRRGRWRRSDILRAIQNL